MSHTRHSPWHPPFPLHDQRNRGEPRVPSQCGRRSSASAVAVNGEGAGVGGNICNPKNTKRHPTSATVYFGCRCVVSVADPPSDGPNVAYLIRYNPLLYRLVSVTYKAIKYW